MVGKVSQQNVLNVTGDLNAKVSGGGLVGIVNDVIVILFEISGSVLVR